VWSHDQGDRPNYITNLPLGKTGWNTALNLSWQQRFRLLYIRRLLTHPSAAYAPVSCLCTCQLLVYLSAACTADHLLIHSSPFVKREKIYTTKIPNLKHYCDHSDHLASKTNTNQWLIIITKQLGIHLLKET
jgi:hypothetical protein